MIVIGAGVGGLVASLLLAVDGFDVTVLERADTPGGKMRVATHGAIRIDAGPTVFTLRGIFDEIFAAAGTSLADHVSLHPVATLARHAWSEHERLDLYCSIERSVDAIGAFAGAAEARRYREFAECARRIYATLEAAFIRAPATSALGLVRSAHGRQGLADLWHIRPFATLWQALQGHFRDPRLRQLFARYATYCGSSPFRCPATLMLIAHAERAGVWLVDGGMRRLAEGLAAVATARGATFRYGADVVGLAYRDGRVAGVQLASGEQIAADAILANADVAAIASGGLGRDAAHAVPRVPRSARSLSALTWTMVARTAGFPLHRHNVFFSGDYRAEFDDLFAHGRLPRSPTVYVCAQDRDDEGVCASAMPERLLCLVNAPPTGDCHSFTPAEIEQCEKRTFDLLARCGLDVMRSSENTTITTPEDFERLFPGTGGALYGRATHGWAASFRRPGARSRIPGLYLAGGSTHPGAGVPMAALSGRMAAATLRADRASTSRSRLAGMPGGISTH